jgi:putative membrane protein insertion efficiency factor
MTEPRMDAPRESTARPLHIHSKLARSGAHALIRGYQLTLSSIMGRHCRYLPTCSEYTDEAIQRHGLWAGGWIGFARICRCRPGAASGYDPVPDRDPRGRPYTPWRYADWRGPRTCEAVEKE